MPSKAEKMKNRKEYGSMTRDKMRQMALNLSWMCKRENERCEKGENGEGFCPCLPQNGCPWDLEGKTCPATYLDWLEWMEEDEAAHEE